MMKFNTLEVQVEGGVGTVVLNRPAKLNAWSREMYREFASAFNWMGREESGVRVVVVRANGRVFTAGLDLNEYGALFQSISDHPLDTGRKTLLVKQMIAESQEAFRALERCNKPVIAAVHGACVGAGVDLLSACDIRVATDTAFFAIKEQLLTYLGRTGADVEEVDIGMAADLGTIQRMPRCVSNHSTFNLLLYTGSRFSAAEALQLGFLSKTFSAQTEMMSYVSGIAAQIASKSPIAIEGIKSNLVYSQNHTVEDSLDRMAIWNAAMLQSQAHYSDRQDVQEAIAATLQKRKAEFGPLLLSKL